ncbi:MAG: hypothetical protein WDW38_009161 [Sanguina aurantia]
MCHYTWSVIYKEAGDGVVPLGEAGLDRPEVPLMSLPPNPWSDTWVMQDGKPVTLGLHDFVTAMLTQMNAAITDLPDLTPAVAA